MQLRKTFVATAALCGMAPALSSTLSAAHADVRVTPLFSSNMILQRNLAAPVWGTAEPGEAVTVSISGQTQKTVAGADGKWMVKLAPLAAAESLEMTISGKNTLTFQNVAVGEVWIASGQSNMTYRTSNSLGAKEAFAAPPDPSYRLFTVENVGSPEPLTALKGGWTSAKPGSISPFSAVAYFFGRDLRRSLGVPVGIIHSSVPGTAAEAWTSRVALEANPGFKRDILDPADKYARDIPVAIAKYNNETLPAWQKAADEAKAAGTAIPPKPKEVVEWYGGGSPFRLFNGKIAPLIPFGIAGAIWYQGEANSGRAKQYQTLFPTMIKDWRTRWNQGDFPFGFVQLANLGEQQSAPSEGGWAAIREAQRLSLTVPNTGMASAVDVGQSYDLHPNNKQAVGQRLALWALATVYGQKLEYTGPQYDSMRIEGNKIRVLFKKVGGPPVVQDVSARFANERIPRHNRASAQLDQLQSAGLMQDSPVAYDNQKELKRSEAAQIVAAIDAKLAAAEDAGLDKTQLTEGVDRAKVKAALVWLRASLRPQITQLITPWNGQLQGFAISGADDKWIWADAVIDGDTVLVSSPQVPQPIAVRYNWSGNPIGNLYNKAGLPASSFSTDNKW